MIDLTTSPVHRAWRRVLSCLLALSASLLSMAPTLAHAAGPQFQSRQFTFAWPFAEGDELAPRGGITRGAPITLHTEPGEAWRRLQEPGLTAFERDRRAILAMAGEYRASFDFLEVAGFTAGHRPTAPYQSWATEKVYVLADEGRFISLQHVLVMRMADENGKAGEPFVTKHWRQDWQYEPATRFDYRGSNTWARVDVPEGERAGRWRQSVYQVDDSPRYAGIGRWQHFGNYSTWVSGETWRPLPRREFSVRDDYQVLLGTNRHTITPTGWIHEEMNNKVRLDGEGRPSADAPVVAREFGFNRYERISGYDFAPGDRYVESTDALWKIVREEWNAMLYGGQPVRLRGAPDRDQMFGPLFEMAAALEGGARPGDQEKWQAEVRSAVREYLR